MNVALMACTCSFSILAGYLFINKQIGCVSRGFPVNHGLIGGGRGRSCFAACGSWMQKVWG